MIEITNFLSNQLTFKNKKLLLKSNSFFKNSGELNLLRGNFINSQFYVSGNHIGISTSIVLDVVIVTIRS